MIPDQKCAKCELSRAAVKVTRLSKGVVEEIWLCKECAAKQTPLSGKPNTLSIEALLSGILGTHVEAVGPLSVVPASSMDIDATCSTCGLPFASYRAQSILGCSDCYTSFEEPLLADLQKFHGCVTHQGRVPGSAPRQFQRIADAEVLRDRLTRAVTNEDFILAAELRDKLRGLEASDS